MIELVLRMAQLAFLKDLVRARLQRVAYGGV